MKHCVPCIQNRLHIWMSERHTYIDMEVLIETAGEYGCAMLVSLIRPVPHFMFRIPSPIRDTIMDITQAN